MKHSCYLIQSIYELNLKPKFYAEVASKDKLLLTNKVASFIVDGLISTKPYRGVNTLLLGSTSFSFPYWLTFNQVQQLGGRVKKGAKSELVIFRKFLDSQKGTDEGSGSDPPTISARAACEHDGYGIDEGVGSRCDVPRTTDEQLFDEQFKRRSQFIQAAIDGLMSGQGGKPLAPVVAHVIINAALGGESLQMPEQIHG